MIKYYTNGMTLPDYSINGPERVNNIVEAEIFVVDGGDGTILRSFQHLCINNVPNIPILGINTGHVGFLSNDITKAQAMSFLKNPDWSKIEKRSSLLINIDGVNFYGLNEVVVQPLSRGALFETSLKVNSDKLSYKGDGLIISTPSGSTAYNLSAGGSIVNPNTSVLSIAPICPFSLAARPLIISDESKLMIATTAPSEITIDGASVFKGVLYNVSVTKSNFMTNLIKFSSFFDAISTKLGWNYSIK
jgi:NAD+ kinase